MVMIEVVLTILHVIKVKAIKWYKNWHWQRNCDGSRNRNKKGTVNGTGNGSG